MQKSKFSPSAQKVIVQSQGFAKKFSSQAIEPEHLALALIETSELSELLSKKKIDFKSLESALINLIKKLPKASAADLKLSGRSIQVIGRAEALALSKSLKAVRNTDLFLSLLEQKDHLGSLGNLLSQTFLENRCENKTANDLKKLSPELQKIAENLNIELSEKKIEPTFGREQEISRLIQVLARKSRNNPILIGEPGVGRSSIVYGLAAKILEQKTPSHLIAKEILSLDFGALVAGTTLRGQFEERVTKILSELKHERERYILFARDISLLIGAGGDGASSAASLIQPSLKKGEIQIIGLATQKSYKEYIESNPSFQRYFQPIWIDEPDFQECETILQGLKENFEAYHGVFIKDEAVIAAIELGKRHISGKVLPSLALDLIDEACARHRISIEKKPAKIKDLEEKILKSELEIAEKTSSKKNQTKSKRSQKNADPLKEKLADYEQQYEKEISLIESMRSIKRELASIRSEVKLSQNAGDLKQALKIKKEQEELLSKELQKRESEFKKIPASKRLVNPYIEKSDVAEIISLETGIPVKKMVRSEREKLVQFESWLKERVVGQDSAVKAVANAVRRARVGIKDLKKPIGSFLFMGPTGVGKTELARTLTNFLFEDERAMIRFDMSEFMEKHTVARLIGAPPGYQGASEGGQLTEAVRRKPFSVVLFDEIEKAHNDVLNVLLQVLDEGRLSDSSGQLVSFSNTVVIMTSNVGSDIILREENRKSSSEEIKSKMVDALLQFLRPELLNRIDEVVVFEPLDEKSIEVILEILLKSLTQRLAHQKIVFSCDDEVKNILIKAGFQREFGARPLKRAVRRLVENPLASFLLAQKIDKKIKIKAVANKNCQIEFKVS